MVGTFTDAETLDPATRIRAGRIIDHFGEVGGWINSVSVSLALLIFHIHWKYRKPLSQLDSEDLETILNHFAEEGAVPYDGGARELQESIDFNRNMFKVTCAFSAAACTGLFRDARTTVSELETHFGKEFANIGQLELEDYLEEFQTNTVNPARAIIRDLRIQRLLVACSHQDAGSDVSADILILLLEWMNQCELPDIEPRVFDAFVDAAAGREPFYSLGGERGDGRVRRMFENLTCIGTAILNGRRTGIGKAWTVGSAVRTLEARFSARISEINEAELQGCIDEALRTGDFAAGEVEEDEADTRHRGASFANVASRLASAYRLFEDPRPAGSVVAFLDDISQFYGLSLADLTDSQFESILDNLREQAVTNRVARQAMPPPSPQTYPHGHPRRTQAPTQTSRSHGRTHPPNQTTEFCHPDPTTQLTGVIELRRHRAAAIQASNPAPNTHCATTVNDNPSPDYPNHHHATQSTPPAGHATLERHEHPHLPQVVFYTLTISAPPTTTAPSSPDAPIPTATSTILTLNYSTPLSIDLNHVSRDDEKGIVHFAHCLSVRSQAVFALGLEFFAGLVWVELVGAVDRGWMAESVGLGLWGLWGRVVGR
ncbi:hypothetical protein MBLNU230_g6637t1 [Neophaeotheca triangularis]